MCLSKHNKHIISSGEYTHWPDYDFALDICGSKIKHDTEGEVKNLTINIFLSHAPHRRRNYFTLTKLGYDVNTNS